MKNYLVKVCTITMFLLGSSLGYANNIGEKIDATTATGDKVILKPNGRWEYVDRQKASEAEKVANQYPENKVCPPGSQGGWFGTKCILPGDKAFNRKSRIGK